MIFEWKISILWTVKNSIWGEYLTNVYGKSQFSKFYFNLVEIKINKLNKRERGHEEYIEIEKYKIVIVYWE